MANSFIMHFKNYFINSINYCGLLDHLLINYFDFTFDFLNDLKIKHLFNLNIKDLKYII